MRATLRVPTAVLSLTLPLLALGCADRGDAPTAPVPAAARPAAAKGGAPQTGGGTGVVTGLAITSSRTAGGNVIQERRLTGRLAGTLVGSFVEEVRGVIHANGLVTFEGTLEFTGTLSGCGAGTLAVGLTGQGQTGLPVTDATMRVVDAASSTIPATGTGTLHQVGPSLTYDVRYVCH